MEILEINPCSSRSSAPRAKTLHRHFENLMSQPDRAKPEDAGSMLFLEELRERSRLCPAHRHLLEGVRLVAAGLEIHFSSKSQSLSVGRRITPVDTR